jgi:hypothetical protein
MSENTTYQQQTLLSADSLASLTVTPGSEEAQKMTVTSGLNILELLERSSRDLSLAKMFLASSQLCSIKFYLTWRTSVTPAKRLLFQLVPSMPLTEGTEFLSLPSPTASDADRGAIIGAEDEYRITSTGMPRRKNRNGKDGSVGLARLVQILPTPTAADHYKGNLTSSQTTEGSMHSVTLPQFIQTLPTPTARDWKGPTSYKDQFDLPREVGKATGLKLQPAFVEWMMGFPIGWTDLEASETP